MPPQTSTISADTFASRYYSSPEVSRPFQTGVNEVYEEVDVPHFLLPVSPIPPAPLLGHPVPDYDSEEIDPVELLESLRNQANQLVGMLNNAIRRNGYEIPRNYGFIHTAPFTPQPLAPTTPAPQTVRNALPRTATFSTNASEARFIRNSSTMTATPIPPDPPMTMPRRHHSEMIYEEPSDFPISTSEPSQHPNTLAEVVPEQEMQNYEIETRPALTIPRPKTNTTARPGYALPSKAVDSNKWNDRIYPPTSPLERRATDGAEKSTDSPDLPPTFGRNQESTDRSKIPLTLEPSRLENPIPSRPNEATRDVGSDEGRTNQTDSSDIRLREIDDSVPPNNNLLRYRCCLIANFLSLE